MTIGNKDIWFELIFQKHFINSSITTKMYDSIINNGKGEQGNVF